MLKAYNIYKNFIDKKHDLMNTNINIISNIYKAFKTLCKMYTACNENNKKCTNCSKDAEELFKNLKSLMEILIILMEYSLFGFCKRFQRQTLRAKI
ncbi:hypothetical protein YYG_04478 [Plasmodium vinckei petteri]|uniref:PIR protein CIR protein n=1 Tax=Plasmodium vinckei petteri TaxID=138298 RepID=W7AAD3_PLAVN|nr:hypothetical protein YYG_04478 [Plasmodium vinckei petteri]